MLLTFCASMAFTLMLSQSPVAMGLWVLLMALAISITLSLFSTSWFSFLLFLIYIGGMLVMFAYFVALQPNQRLKLLPMFSMSFLFFPILLLSTYNLPFLCKPHPQSSSFSSITVVTGNWNNAPFYLYLAIILFLTLVAVVKITNLRKGALRPFTPTQ